VPEKSLLTSQSLICGSFALDVMSAHPSGKYDRETDAWDTAGFGGAIYFGSGIVEKQEERKNIATIEKSRSINRMKR